MNTFANFSVRSFALLALVLGGCAEMGNEMGDEDSNVADTESAAGAAAKEAEPEQSPEAMKEKQVAKAASALDIAIPPWINGLTASANTLSVGGTATITAATSVDVGPTPYYIEIFDATTGARVAGCGTGSSCRATVSQSAATTHAYVAYVANPMTTTMPTNGYVSKSANMYVTWSNSGYTVSVPNNVTCVSPTGSARFNATANIDVGPTPYYIEVYNDSGVRIAHCGNGTSCPVNVACGSFAYTAFISDAATTPLPTNIQASSNMSWTAPSGI